jgi:hypothetical protein
MKNKGIEMDYGKKDRSLFLEKSLQEQRWEKLTKFILVFMVIYFGFHIYNALADTVVQTPIGTVYCL